MCHLQVWLPLYPRDEGHPNFLSKRIMLTLYINVYTQGMYVLAVTMATGIHEQQHVSVVLKNINLTLAPLCP